MLQYNLWCLWDQPIFCQYQNFQVRYILILCFAFLGFWDSASLHVLQVSESFCFPSSLVNWFDHSISSLSLFCSCSESQMIFPYIIEGFIQIIFFRAHRVVSVVRTPFRTKNVALNLSARFSVWVNYISLKFRKMNFVSVIMIVIKQFSSILVYLIIHGIMEDEGIEVGI